MKLVCTPLIPIGVILGVGAMCLMKKTQKHAAGDRSFTEEAMT